MFRVKSSLILSSLVDFDSPSSVCVLARLGYTGFCPYGQLHRGSVPLHKEAELLCRCVGRPVLWVGEVREVISPVWEMEGEIFVSIPPDRTDLLGSLDNESGDTQGLESSS